MSNVFTGISDFLSGGQTGAAQAQNNSAPGIIANTPLPDLAALIPQLQKQVQQGTMTPAQYQAILQNPSAYNSIKTNPENMAAAEDALQQQRQIATQGGMTAIDKAQLNDIQNQVGNQNAAEQAAITQQNAEKGLGSGGAALAQRLAAAQGNAQGASNAGATVASNAQARALQALQGSGSLGQSLNAQDFGQQAQAAQAQNAINQFNAGNQTAAAAQNAANQQAANSANFNTANTIAGKNTDITNQNLMMPLQTAQQQYTNQFGQDKATSDADLAAAKQNATQGNAQASTSGDLISTAMKYGPDIAALFGSDEKQKTDVKPAEDDVETMMEKLSGKKFRYKDSSAWADGGKEHVGVMAQDVEKAGLPTVNTPQGKMVVDNDTNKGAVLAALGNLHKRIKTLETK